MTRREPLRAVVRTILRALGHKLGGRPARRNGKP